MTSLKKLIGKKSLNAKQFPAGLSLNLYGKPCGWAEYPVNSQKFTNFSIQKNPP